MQRNGFELPSLDEPPEPYGLSDRLQPAIYDKPYTRQRKIIASSQAREQRKQAEKEKLVHSIFGESNNKEDKELCIRMIDYFNDYCSALVD